MALSKVDWSERGYYAASSKCPYASRYDVARYSSFYVSPRGGGLFVVRRSGGNYHYVRACDDEFETQGDCDCADWLMFGKAYRRPCVHIWKVIRSQALGVC